MKVTLYLTIILLAAILSLSGCSRHYGLTTKEVESQITRELREGSDASEIASFLDRNGMEHTGVVEMPSMILEDPNLDTYFNNPKLEGKRHRVKKSIIVRIADVKYGFMTSFDIGIKFFLDHENKLVEAVVRSIGTGL